MTKRTGRLSLRMTPDFIELCTQVAASRGQSLTDFVQLAMATSLARKPLDLPKEGK